MWGHLCWFESVQHEYSFLQNNSQTEAECYVQFQCLAGQMTGVSCTVIDGEQTDATYLMEMLNQASVKGTE